MREQQKIRSGDLTFEGLICEEKYLFKVSNYQRHYVWTTKEIQQFLMDGEFCWEQKKKGQHFIHFAGQITLRLISEERDQYKQMEIVDGQQRITTFLMLTAAAAQKMSLLGFRQEAKLLRERFFVVKSEFTGTRARLELSPTDRDFWKALTGEEDVKLPPVSTESHKHLLNAKKVVINFLDTLSTGKTEAESAEIWRDYIEALASSFRIVLLKTCTPGYAYALYQTVNDRGVPLTSGELLKARTIELLSDNSELADYAERIWDNVLKDAGTDTDRYLNWNYTAVTGKKMELKRTVAAHELYERDIFGCYRRRMLYEEEQLKVKSQLEKLEMNVERMRKLSQGCLELPVNEETRILFGALVRMLKNSFCIPVYLKILDMEERKAVAALNWITPMLAKTFFIAKTMGNLHDGVISNCYLEILKSIHSSCIEKDEIKKSLERVLKRDNCEKEFTSKINEAVYVRGGSGNAKAKFLLLMLELQEMKEHEKGSQEYIDDAMPMDLQKLSVEHILSESVDPVGISKEFYAGLHKLGNLTLVGGKINTRMKNDPFETKRTRYQRSPFYITRKVGELEEWRKADFDKRQKEMTEALTAAFKL